MRRIKKNLSLQEKYEEEVVPALKKELGIKNPLAIPRITKIVVNMGIQDAAQKKELFERLVSDMSIITGQKPVVRPARLSVAGFNIRAGNPVGLKVTLRRERMYAFLERLISITLPRLRDFRGLPLKAFDKEGNYTIGIKEYSVFPEIEAGKMDKPRGLEITIVSNAANLQEARRLFELLGMPFGESKN